jgi:hypothetical protein
MSGAILLKGQTDIVLGNGQPLVIPNALANGTSNANVAPTAAQAVTYLTTQYASQTTTQLQALLATRKPTDFDYAIISNLLSADQYSQKATVAYSGMSLSALAATVPTLTNTTDQAIATAALVQKYKTQDASMPLAQAYSAMQSSSTSAAEKAALTALDPSVSASPSYTFAPIRVTVTPPPPPKNSSSCPKYSLGCLGFDDLTMGSGDAPFGLQVAAAALTGVVASVVTVAVTAPFAPVEFALPIAASTRVVNI